MAYLVDTSVLARLANSAGAFYPIAVRAVVELHRRGEQLKVAPQNLIEFRSVATRPILADGSGLSSAQASAKMSIFETAFPMLAENPSIYPSWKGVVGALAVVGKQVHDARLVVTCHVHGVSHLLTFNVAHFARLSAYGPGLLVVDPANVQELSATCRSQSNLTVPIHRPRSSANRAQLIAALDARCWMIARG